MELLTSYTHVFNTEARILDHFLNFLNRANVLVIVIKEGGLLSSRLFFLTGKLSDEVRYEKKADTPIEMMTIQ